MTNKLYIGTKRKVEQPPGGFLLIDDDPRTTRSNPRLFDPTEHFFNPLRHLDYRKSCDFVDIIGALYPGGESTLTRESGLEFIAEALEGNPKTLEDLIPFPGPKAPTGHVWAYSKVQRILRSPVLKRMLCGSGKEFSFNPRSVILARVNRAELGEFDARAVGLFLMSQYQGRIVLPDAGFYLREHHASLLRENRLIIGVDLLSELPEELRDLALLKSERVAAGAFFDDAILLAKLEGKVPDTIEFNDAVAAAMRDAPGN